MPREAFALALVCAALIVAGASMFAIPAGLIAAGTLGLPLVWAWGYYRARAPEARR